MKTNKIDKKLQEKFKNRTFEPSVSAWERLNDQLDNQKKQQKKRWYLYAGYAASITLLISLFFMMNKNDVKEKIILEDVIVVEAPKPVKIESDFKETNITNKTIEVANNSKKILQKKKRQIFAIERNYQKNSTPITVKEIPVVIAKVDKIIKKTNLPKKIFSEKKGIKVSGKDLLYAVTHNKKEVQEYYAKYNVNRSDVLKTIKKELEKSKLKIDPTTILAEVERDIDDDFFKNSFKQNLKSKITIIATAIVNRNNR